MGQEEIQFFQKVHLDLYQIWEGGRVWEQEAGIQSCKSHWFLSYKVGKPHVKRSEYRSSSFIQNLKRSTLMSMPSLLFSYSTEEMVVGEQTPVAGAGSPPSSLQDGCSYSSLNQVCYDVMV